MQRIVQLKWSPKEYGEGGLERTIGRPVECPNCQKSLMLEAHGITCITCAGLASAARRIGGVIQIRIRRFFVAVAFYQRRRYQGGKLSIQRPVFARLSDRRSERGLHRGHFVGGLSRRLQVADHPACNQKGRGPATLAARIRAGKSGESPRTRRG